MRRSIVVGAGAGLAVIAVIGGCQSGPGARHTEGMSADTAFAHLRALAGDWKGKGSHGESIDAGTRFDLTSGGSVVRETMFPGTDHEMVNMYSIDRGAVAMTHYCMMGNQPHLRLTSVRGNIYHFEYVSGGNIARRDEPHMDSMVMTLDGPDHLTSEWTSWADGKPTADKAVFDLYRVKADAHAAR
jgi:hypothetical protein